MAGRMAGRMKGPLKDWQIGRDIDRASLPRDEVDFLRFLAGPTLLRLPGRDPSRVRILSTLLHGNEPSGLRAIVRYLRSNEVPATDVIFFVGSVSTALAEPRFSHRTLPGRIDANRCWTAPWDTDEGQLARSVLDRMLEASPEALVDVHNNTGHNPAYGVAFRVGPEEHSLVSLFADRIVHTPIELGTLVEATISRCPSVTIECGRAGDAVADAVAWSGVCCYLGREELDLRAPTRPLLHLEEPVRVCVRPGGDLAFGECANRSVALTVSADIDRHNFERLPAGSAIAWVTKDSPWPIEAFGPDGSECSRRYFEIDSGVLRTRREFIPIMMTTSRVIAKSDCLFYAVQPAPDSTGGEEDDEAISR
jgi:hypothetical protein